MSAPADTDAAIRQLLEDLGYGEPQVQKLILAALGPDREAAAQAPETRALVARLRRSERLNKALMAKLEMLACGLGACPSCWGADPDCDDCGGEGRPGRMQPDARCFRRFVAPVLDRVAELAWTPPPRAWGAAHPPGPADPNKEIKSDE